MNPLAPFTNLLRGVLNRADILRRFLPGPSGPGIDSVTPGTGWPGTIIEIRGGGFSLVRDDNEVQVGGDPALVLDAAEDRLLVAAGRNTVSGPVTVTVGGSTANAADDFKVLDYPEPDDLSADGPPVFYDGPQSGTPRVNVQNQRVLIAFAAPTDHPGGAGGPMLRNDVLTHCSEAATYWNQATYGQTTWAFESTPDWYDLPQERRFYFWEQGDIDDARRALITQTNAAIGLTGQAVLVGAANGLVPVDYPIPGTVDVRPQVNLASRLSAIRVVGNRGYAVAGASGLRVLDLTNPLSPTTLGSAPIAGWGAAVDVTGTTVVVAGRDAGLVVYDVANPAAPAQVAAVGTPSWAVAVRLDGSTAILGAGTQLIPYDVATPAAPSAGAAIDLGSWITAIDIAGATCVVATDGDGLRVFDLSGANPVEIGAWRGALRLRDVVLAGTTAYVAANDAGLFAVDLSNPAAPNQLGTLATDKPAYSVAARGSTVFVATGNRKLTSVDASNPAAMTVHHADVLYSGGDPDLTALRNQLQQAIDGQALVKDGDRLMLDSLTRAGNHLPAGRHLTDYEGFIIFVNGGGLRGQSWTQDQFHVAGVGDLMLGQARGMIYLAPSAAPGRIAHEIGHWLGMWDIYTDWHSDGTFTPGTAAPWCLSGNHDGEPLWCGHQIQELMKVYRNLSPNDNVIEREWSPSAPPLDHIYEVTAHDATQDPDANPDRVHLLKLKVASGLWYFVEVRQPPNGLLFDQNLPPFPAGEDAVVLVTRVFEGTTISNTMERPIEVFEILAPGQQAVDAARELVIKYDSVVQDRPRIARVRVTWNQPVPPDPAGRFDMSITPWDTHTWETVDIWVDSPRNNSGGTVVYENHAPGQPGQPILNGDRPWVHHTNKIYARIRNTGPMIVPEVFVTCYVTSPPGIGDNGNWATLATKHLTNFPAYDPALPGSGEQVVDFDWIPQGDKHTCIQVAILPQVGEISTTNNHAQENVSSFDSAGSSPHQPVILEAEVRSPFVVRRKVDMQVRGLPVGWHAIVDHSWVWLEGKATKPVSAVIWTEFGTGTGSEKEAPSRGQPRVEGWTWFDHRYLPIGGILADVKANKKVRTRPEIGGDRKGLRVRGCLEPPVSDVPITVEVTDREGRSMLFHAMTDEDGCYDLSDQKTELPPGDYKVQVFVTAGGDAAETETEPVGLTIT